MAGDPLHNFKAVGVKPSFRPTNRMKAQAAELASDEMTSHLERIAKRMARELGETNSWAWLHYIGYAQIWFNREMKGKSRGKFAERRARIMASMDA
jgi:hypothetical protein